MATRPAAAAERPVADGEWGPAEIARHLIAVEREVWRTRFARSAAEDAPALAVDRARPRARVSRALRSTTVLAAFADGAGRRPPRSWRLDDAGWARTGTHATYGVLDVAALLRLAIDHDAEHLAGLASQRD